MTGSPLRSCLVGALLLGALGGAPSAYAAPSEEGVGAADVVRVELNSATAEELCSLPGIGPKKAAAIIEHRARQPFTRVSQLLRVQGIGAKTLKRLRPFVYVRGRAEPAGSDGSVDG